MKKLLFWLVTSVLVVVLGYAQEEPLSEVPTNEEPVELSELKVEHVIERPWLYAELPGIQILSLASKRETAAFVDYLRDKQAFYSKLVPEVTLDDSYKRFTVILESPAFVKIRDAGGPRPTIFRTWRTFTAGLDGDLTLFGDKASLADLGQTLGGRYPNNAEATLAIAILCKKAGKPEQAAELARIGLAWLQEKAPESLRRELTELAEGGPATKCSGRMLHDPRVAGNGRGRTDVSGSLA